MSESNREPDIELKGFEMKVDEMRIGVGSEGQGQDEGVTLRTIRDEIRCQGTKMRYEMRCRATDQEMWMAVTMGVTSGVALVAAGFGISVKSGLGTNLVSVGFLLIIISVILTWHYKPIKPKI